MDNGRCRSGQPRRDGADGAVQRNDVQSSSRITQHGCGFMVSRPRYWPRPDSARAVVGAVPRRFHLQRRLAHPTPPGGHESCKHPLLSTKERAVAVETHQLRRGIARAVSHLRAGGRREPRISCGCRQVPKEEEEGKGEKKKQKTLNAAINLLSWDISCFGSICGIHGGRLALCVGYFDGRGNHSKYRGRRRALSLAAVTYGVHEHILPGRRLSAASCEMSRVLSGLGRAGLKGQALQNSRKVFLRV